MDKETSYYTANEDTDRFIDEAPELVIVDLDGTLANCEHRLHLVRGKPKNWPRFFDLVGDDTVNRHIQRILDGLNAEGIDMLFVSGRPDSTREHSEKWIEEIANYPRTFWRLFMRHHRDNRPDEKVKRDIYHQCLKKAHGKIICVFDDRPKVIRMWREEGLKVLDVGNGAEF